MLFDPLGRPPWCRWGSTLRGECTKKSATWIWRRRPRGARFGRRHRRTAPWRRRNVERRTGSCVVGRRVQVCFRGQTDPGHPRHRRHRTGGEWACGCQDRGSGRSATSSGGEECVHDGGCGDPRPKADWIARWRRGISGIDRGRRSWRRQGERSKQRPPWQPRRRRLASAERQPRFREKGSRMANYSKAKEAAIGRPPVRMGSGRGRGRLQPRRTGERSAR